MLDDAQHHYRDEALWASLIKGDVFTKLPSNIKFVISATYSLCTAESPVDFNTLPKLTLKDFRLSQAEVDEFITLSSAKVKNERAGLLLADPVIRHMISTNCGGHIGALSVSMREIVKQFRRVTALTVEEIVSFYLSTDMCSLFGRCYKSGVTSLPEVMRACLICCVTSGPCDVAQHENPEAYSQLIRCGVLYEAANGTADFVSPAAANFINNLLFPRRSVEKIDEVRKRGVFVLMKSVLAHMSANTLRRSVVDSHTPMCSPRSHSSM